MRVEFVVPLEAKFSLLQLKPHKSSFGGDLISVWLWIYLIWTFTILMSYGSYDRSVNSHYNLEDSLDVLKNALQNWFIKPSICFRFMKRIIHLRLYFTFTERFQQRHSETAFSKLHIGSCSNPNLHLSWRLVHVATLGK